MLQKINTLKDLFYLFFTDTVVRDIVKQTNEKGEQLANGILFNQFII